MLHSSWNIFKRFSYSLQKMSWSLTLSWLGFRREIYNLVPHELKVIILIPRITKLHSNHIQSSCTGLDMHWGKCLVAMETNNNVIVIKHNSSDRNTLYYSYVFVWSTLFNLDVVGKPMWVSYVIANQNRPIYAELLHPPTIQKELIHV